VDVGFIGLGWIGLPMARRIEASDFPLRVWARRPSSVEPFANGPALIARTLPELGASCDVVGVCVLDDSAVEEVLLSRGLLESMRPGSIVAIHSTIQPATCVRLSEVGARYGVRVIDAPVSGGPWAAEAGELSVMVGSDETTFADCLPVFSTFGAFVRRIGPVGSGQVAKLLNNILTSATVGLLFETFALSEQLGLDRDALHQVLVAGSADSRMLRIHPDLSAERARLGAPLLEKDAAILRAVAEAAGFELSLLAAATDKAVATMTALGRTAS
jgi:3-hydroxyisobutyrate dehydrogenase